MQPLTQQEQRAAREAELIQSIKQLIAAIESNDIIDKIKAVAWGGVLVAEYEQKQERGDA